MNAALLKWIFFNAFVLVMLAHTAYQIPTGLSLVVIGLILAVSVIASLAKPKQNER